MQLPVLPNLEGLGIVMPNNECNPRLLAPYYHLWARRSSIISKEERIAKIMAEGFPRGYATAFVESRGFCVYCGEDVLSTLARYCAGTADHLLPRSKYPALSDDPRNFVMACYICNSRKQSLDVLLRDEDPNNMLDNHKEVLIERARQQVFPRWMKEVRKWAKVRSAVRT